MDPRSSKPNTRPAVRPAQDGAATDPTAVRPYSPAPEPLTAADGFLAPPQRVGEVGRLGPYRVLGVLGRGGMGAVYLAEDPRLKRQVAIKVLVPELSADPRAKARFRREAQAQARVEHDHIIPIHEVDEADGVAYIAMPLLKGRTLGAALKQNPRPPVNELVRVGREIAEGLAAAHAAGLTHRDIKPSNVWLEGTRRRVKILDFGLARGATPATGSDPATAAGAIMGTPAYMSPEQARSQPTDPRSDLFSLGVVLYEMATGRRPFTGPSAFDVMAAVVSHDPPPVLEPVPDFPPAVGDLIRRLLAKSPADRPQGAAAVAEELDAAERELSVPPVRVLPPGAIPGAPDPWADIAATEADETIGHVGRTRGETTVLRTDAPKWLWPAVAVGAVVVVALVVLAVSSLRPKVKSDPAQVEESKPKEKEKSPAAPPKKREVDKADEPVPPKVPPKVPPVVPPAAPSGGLAFDGKATVVTVPTLNFEGRLPITIEAWVTPDTVRESHVILLGEPGGGIGLSKDGSLGVGVFDGTDWHSDYSRVKLKPGQTAHVAAVVTKDRLLLFVDGKQVGTKAVKLDAPPATKAPTLIGKPTKNAGGAYFHGTVHGLRVSRTARYAKDFVPTAAFDPDADTVALYRFDEGAGKALTDHSGNKHHGEIDSGVWVAGAKK